jgi:hypothetical protein
MGRWIWQAVIVALFVQMAACQPSADEQLRRALKENEDNHAAAAAREAERKQKERDQTEAETKRQAGELARHRCPSGSGHRIGEGEFRSGCQLSLKRQLVSPKSADFPGVFDDVSKGDESSDCSRTWHAWVEAKNAFGVVMRRDFTCSYNSTTGTVAVALESP